MKHIVIALLLVCAAACQASDQKYLAFEDGYLKTSVEKTLACDLPQDKLGLFMPQPLTVNGQHYTLVQLIWVSNDTFWFRWVGETHKDLARTNHQMLIKVNGDALPLKFKSMFK
jgi:hypothetical protein